jgi:hypothetical protein
MHKQNCQDTIAVTSIARGWQAGSGDSAASRAAVGIDWSALFIPLLTLFADLAPHAIRAQRYPLPMAELSSHLRRDAGWC